MCHPAVIALSADVSFLPSQEIKGVPVSFQLGFSSQSSVCPFSPVAAVAGGVQLCVYREGRVQLPGLDAQTAAWEHLSQPGPAQTETGAVPAWLGWAFRGHCSSCQSLHRGFALLSSTRQLVGPRGEFSPGETSLPLHLGNNKNETWRFSLQCGAFGKDRNDCSSALLNAHCHRGRDAVAAKFGVD